MRTQTTFVPFGREEIEQSIQSRFEQQVRLHAERLAVKTSSHTWTYDELNRAANRIADALLARDGNRRTPVVLLIEQSASVIAALLGILKAGKILVPLDPFHPAARLRQLTDEVQPTCIVTNEAHYETAARLVETEGSILSLEAHAPECSDANPEVPTAPDDFAMILFTSGSTGRPKGVIRDHRSWIHTVRNYTNTLHIGPEDRLTLLALATAQAVRNLTVAILNGASVFPYDLRRDGFNDLAALLGREAITITVMGASLFRSFADVLGPADTFPALRVINLASEPVQPRDVDLYRKHFSSRCHLVNGLGSSEAGTLRFFLMDHQTAVSGSVVPVGYPVEDQTVLLLGDTGEEVEAGQVGEIVVESRYLAPGYWRRPDLTEAVFRPAGIPGGPRRFHTGDLGRMTPDGCLVCLGRKNARVKIRGHGVDLLEVEMALRTVDNVKDSVVVAHQNRAGYLDLVGYVEPFTLPGPTNTILRQALAKLLPDFMMPSTFVVLGALPRTTSGKIDRQALPAPGRAHRDPSLPTTGPRTPMETSIAKIWSDVMDRESIDVYDHFYDLGGESLQALRIVARIRKTFNVDVNLQFLLDAPTVAEMAHGVAERLGAKTDHDERGRGAEGADHEWSYLVPIQSGAGHRPVFLIPGGIGAEGEFFVYGRLARHVGPEYTFDGLQPRSARAKEPAQASVEEMASDYLKEIRSRQPTGPYVIIGDCVGGIVAYEIAQQLRAQGEPPALLVLMDTPRPDLARELRRRSVTSYVRGLPYHWAQLHQLPAKEMSNYLLQRASRFFLKLRSLASRVPVQRSYVQTIDRYRPRPYSGKMTLLVSEELYQRSSHLGWQGLVTGGIDIHTLPGDHYSCIRGHVQTMARTIRECLEKSG